MKYFLNKQIFAVIAATSFAGSSFALGAVSRACSFANIPSVMKTPAIVLFDYLSTASTGKFSYLSNARIAVQGRHWILESITADYISVKYYLNAESPSYR